LAGNISTVKVHADGGRYFAESAPSGFRRIFSRRRTCGTVRSAGFFGHTGESFAAVVVAVAEASEFRSN